MKRWIPIAGLAVALLAAGAVRDSEARVFAHVNLNFGSPGYYRYYRPAPVYYRPAPVYYAPAPVYVEPAPSYYDEDGIGDGCYSYGGYYYRLDDDGCWSRGRSSRGPFASIGVDFVPRVVLGWGSHSGGYSHHRSYDRDDRWSREQRWHDRGEHRGWSHSRHHGDVDDD